MRQAVTFVLTLAALTLALGAGLGKDPPKDKTADPDKPDKKRSFDRISGRTLDEWVRLLKSTDPSIRRDAIHAVQFYGTDSADAVPSLIYILNNDSDSTLRSNAAIVLLNVEVPDSQIPAVVDALSGQLDKNLQINVRFHCAVSLGRFENESHKAVNILIKATTDRGSWEVRQASCYSLARVFSDSKKTPPDARSYNALMMALGDSAYKVRMEALQGLLLFGSPADLKQRERLTRAFLGLLNDREKAIIVWAYVGLILNNGVNDLYLKALVDLLHQNNVATRVEALRALGMLIREAKTDATRKKMPEIIAALQDDDPKVVATACEVLESINEKRELNPDVLAAIKAVADSTDKKVEADLRTYARQTYERMTKKPVKTVKPDKGEKP